MTAPEPLPADLAEAHAMILALRAARLAAEAEAAAVPFPFRGEPTYPVGQISVGDRSELHRR
jgi:hypothetical protein